MTCECGVNKRKIANEEMKFIEIGANLTDPRFRGIYNGKQVHADDFSQMLQRATNAGVERIIVTSGTAHEGIEALQLVKNHDNLFTTIGCHPTRCNEFEENPGGPDQYYQKLLDIATDESAKGKVVAIGECGLGTEFMDILFLYSILSSREENITLTNKLIRIIHMVRKHRDKFTRGVVHSITCDIEEMERAVSLGLHLGINGCSLKTKENLEVARRVPVDLLMIETDAPWCDIRPTHASYSHLNSTTLSKEMMELYQPPSRKKEKFEQGLMVKGRNEPCCIGQVLYVLASIRGTNPETLAEKIYENTRKFFFNEE
ncbi:14692_t:CDS:2 [Acaulospora morrowiae]|uniref:14692_t:CDS:1 n=1 Tax=Acaulospora morrowiae TaxID=94023 RepID=A0A9N8WFM7_9GLOM|nr:14692_t:CDS:2 [Acaulospora morrowiae]